MKLYHLLILIFLSLFLHKSLYSSHVIEVKSNLNQDSIKTCTDCHTDIVKKKIIHSPAEECENCHVSNDNVHPDSKEKGFSLADNVPSLCFYCHEEYSKKNIHAPAEAGECSMCHNSHSSDYPKLLNSARTDKLCFECHDMEVGEKDRVHAPVEMGSCEACHDSHQSDNRSFLIAKSPELCFNCHEDVKEQKQKKNLHAPFDDDCSNCHQSHKAPEKGLLSEPMPSFCFSCHEEYTQKNIHAPAESGECSMCHNSHSSDNPKLLNDSRIDKLCFECHDMEIPKADIVHTPVEEGACNECHDSHQSNNRAFLKTTTPQLCFNCHSSEEEQMQLRKLHAPFEDCSNCHQSHNASEKGLLSEKTSALCYTCHGELQENVTALKFVHAPMKDEKSCSNCHSPHASKENSILLMPEKGLCLSCHGRTYTTELGKTENIKQKLKSGNNIHAPVEEGCVICHKSHAGNNVAMLNNTFPSGNYAEAKEENFALCFECHDSGLMLNEFTTDATNFRNGNVNMHYLHIKGEKGRSCNTCHDSHGAKGKFLINDKVLFGNWEMDMNFVVNEFGGSCATGCHAEEKYDRSVESINISDSLAKEQPSAVAQNRYQNYTEHIQAIDSSVIKFNENLDMQLASKEDSLKQVLLAQNIKDSVIVDTIQTELVVQNELVEEIKKDSIKVQKEIAVIEPVMEKVEEEKEIPKEAPKEITKVEPQKEKILSADRQVEFPNIDFEFSKADINSRGEMTISKVADYLLKNPDLQIELHGYADSIGAAKYNLYLSELRAQKVKELLLKKEIEASRIKVRGFGEIKSNEKDQNRRVEFVIK